MAYQTPENFISIAQLISNMRGSLHLTVKACYPARTVNVKGQPKAVCDMRLEDETGEVKYSAWDTRLHSLQQGDQVIAHNPNPVMEQYTNSQGQPVQQWLIKFAKATGGYLEVISSQPQQNQGQQFQSNQQPQFNGQANTGQQARALPDNHALWDQLFNYLCNNGFVDTGFNTDQTTQSLLDQIYQGRD